MHTLLYLQAMRQLQIVNFVQVHIFTDQMSHQGIKGIKYALHTYFKTINGNTFQLSLLLVYKILIQYIFSENKGVARVFIIPLISL